MSEKKVFSRREVFEMFGSVAHMLQIACAPLNDALPTLDFDVLGKEHKEALFEGLGLINQIFTALKNDQLTLADQEVAELKQEEELADYPSEQDTIH